MSFKWNESKHTYELTQYSSVEKAKAYLDNIAVIDFEIKSDADYTLVKNRRTEINGLTKELATQRKQMTSIVLSSFAPQCIEIEKHGAKLANELTEKLEAYKPTPKKEKAFKLVIKTKDLNTLKKLEKMALKFGCEVSTD